MTKKKTQSTYEKFVSSLSPKEKAEFEQEYLELSVSEMLLAAMEEDNISVRKLSEISGVSPTIIQEVKSGTRPNVSLRSFCKILKGLGYTLTAEKNGLKVPFDALRK